MSGLELVGGARRRAAQGGREEGSEDVLARLEAWPQLMRRLRIGAPGHELCGLSSGASSNELENEVGTRLMALYRDTRSEEIFEALYCFSRASILRWIQSLLRKGSGQLDPVELLQDTFVNVYRYPASFRDEHSGSFRVWVRTIAGNIVRRASGRTSAISFQQLPEGLREPADESINPELQAVLGEQGVHLREAWSLFLMHYAAAWEQLSERDRRSLYLVEVLGLSYELAGEELGVKRSNMKMIVFRARKRIAARMRQAMRSAPLEAPEPTLRLAS